MLLYDVDKAVYTLQKIIHDMMDEHFGSKTVRLSSRDPVYITPLVKYLMTKRAKLVRRNKDTFCINTRINKLIAENRRILGAIGGIGTQAW